MTVITWQRASQLCEHETRHTEKQKAEGAETTPEAKADDLKNDSAMGNGCDSSHNL